VKVLGFGKGGGEIRVWCEAFSKGGEFQWVWFGTRHGGFWVRRVVGRGR
jgi:hypothetical protein